MIHGYIRFTLFMPLSQSIAETTAGTVKLLANLESTYKAIATYWATEAENLESQCIVKESSQTADIAAQKDNHLEDKITAWRTAKKEINDYVLKISEVNNSFNFETAAKPPEAQTVEYEHLDFALKVPATVDLQEMTYPLKLLKPKYD